MVESLGDQCPSYTTIKSWIVEFKEENQMSKMNTAKKDHFLWRIRKILIDLIRSTFKSISGTFSKETNGTDIICPPNKSLLIWYGMLGREGNL